MTKTHRRPPSCASLLSHVWLCVIPWTVAHQAPLSMEILQARILEWFPMSSSRGSPQPRERIQVSCLVGGFFTIWATREAHYTGVGIWSLSPGDLSHSGIEPGSPPLQADSGHRASKWQILNCGPGCVIPKHVHERAKWKCWLSTINLLLPTCSQLFHCWLLNPNSRKLSFDSSFFLTPPFNPLAMISVPVSKHI